MFNSSTRGWIDVFVVGSFCILGMMPTKITVFLSNHSRRCKFYTTKYIAPTEKLQRLLKGWNRSIFKLLNNPSKFLHVSQLSSNPTLSNSNWKTFWLIYNSRSWMAVIVFPLMVTVWSSEEVVHTCFCDAPICGWDI